MARETSVARGYGRFVLLASVCLVVAVLYVGREVLRPIALAILVTFLLSPLVTRLERLRVPRVAAALAVVVFSFAVVGGVGWVMYGQVADLADKLPGYKENIRSKVHAVRSGMSGGAISKATKVVEEITRESSATKPANEAAVAARAGETVPAGQAPAVPAKVDGENVAAQPVVVAPSTTAGLDHPGETFSGYAEYLHHAATAGLVVILVIFMLLGRDDLRDRVIRLAGSGRLNLTTQALEDAAKRVSKFLVAQSLVNGAYGLAIGAGLWVIGLPNAALWGLMCGLLRFVPYAGPWIGAAIPVVLAVGVFEGHTRVLLTIGWFVVVEVLAAMVVEPLVFGAHTGVSPLAILVGAAFWTWVWGPIGLVMATPLTVLLAVTGKYVPSLSFLSVLLGDEPVLEPKIRYYQRLLADDSEDAEELIEEYMKEKPLEEVYDEVVIPALGMAERDLYAGRLTVDKHGEILNCIHEMVEMAWERSMEKLKAVGEGPEARGGDAVRRACVMCLPARDRADEIAALMTAQVLVENGIPAKYQSVKALASEMLDAVDAECQEVVVITALPPEAVTHARYLVKRARSRWSEKPIVVSLLATRTEREKAVGRIVTAGTQHVGMSFAETREAVRQQVQPYLIGEKTTEGPKTADVVVGAVTTREVPGAKAVVAAKEAGAHGREDGARREGKTRVE